MLVRSSNVGWLLGVLVLVVLTACGRPPEPVAGTPPVVVEPVTVEVGAEGAALELADGVRLRIGAGSDDASAHVTLARDGASELAERGFVTGSVYAVSFDAVSGTLPESYRLEFPVAERIPGSAFEIVLYDGDERTPLEGSIDGDVVRVEVPLPVDVAGAADGVARQSSGSQRLDLGEVLSVLVQYADSGAQEPAALKRDTSGCIVDGEAYPVCFIAQDGSGRPFVAAEDEISAMYFVAYDSDGKKIVSIAKAALPVVAVAAVTVKTGGGALLTGTKAALAVSKTVTSFLTMINDLSTLSETITRGINCYRGMCRTRDVETVRVDDTNMLAEIRVAFLGPDWCQAGTGCGWLNFHFTDAQDRVPHDRMYIWVRLSQVGGHLHGPRVYGFEFKSLERALGDRHRGLTVGEYEFNTEYCPNGSTGMARNCGTTKLEVLGIALVRDAPGWWIFRRGEPQLVALHANVPGEHLPPVDEAPGEDPLRVSVRPTSATLAPKEQHAFEAIVSGSEDDRVDWSVPASCGSISSEGLYTAPAHAASCEVTATSRVDRSASGTAEVTVRHLEPVIDSFTANPSRVAFGTQSTLSWSVQGAQPMRLLIDRGVGDVSSRSTTSVGPTTTTIFTLTASNAHGSATREVTVTVDDPTDGRPIARLVTDPPGQARVGQIVRLDASDSVFGSGSRLRYEFTTGDGRSRDQSGAVWSISYGRVGTFEPCVRVRNTLGDVSEWLCQRLNVVDEPAGGADFVIDNYTSDQVSQWNFFGKSIDHGEGFTLRVTWYNDGDPLPEDHPEFETHVYADTELVARRVTSAGRSAGIDFAADRFGRFGRTLEPGTYTIVMIVNATNSIPEIDASNNTASFILHVRSHPPTADFGFETECLTATFEDTSQHPSGAERIVRRVWTFDDGNSSTLTNPVHTFDEPGTYQVRLSVEDEWGNNDRRTRSVLVEACDPPTEPATILSFDAAPSSVFAGESATLTWSVSGSQPISLVISPDVGDVLGQSSVVVSPSETTTYTLTAENDAGTDTASTTVSVSAAPAVSVSVEPSSVSLLVNETQSFTASVAGASDTGVTWDASCGSVSGSGNTVTYTAPDIEGGCEVTATSVADPTKSATASVTIVADSGPVPNVLIDDFDDRDYTVNPSWTHFIAGNKDLDPALNYVDVSNQYARWVSSSHGGRGGSVGLEIGVDIPVSDDTHLQFDALATFRDVGAGCGWNCREYPANVALHLEDASGGTFQVIYAVNYGDALEDQLHDDRRFITTPVAQDIWERGLRFNVRDGWPSAVRVTMVRVYGSGWNFDGGIDNIALPAPAGVRVSVDPSALTLPVNGSQSFTATVTGASDTSVTWEASCGSVPGTGNPVTYTAPGTVGECEVTATSVADPAASATASVVVTDAPGSVGDREIVFASGPVGGSDTDVYVIGPGDDAARLLLDTPGRVVQAFWNGSRTALVMTDRIGDSDRDHRLIQFDEDGRIVGNERLVRVEGPSCCHGGSYVYGWHPLGDSFLYKKEESSCTGNLVWRRGLDGSEEVFLDPAVVGDGVVYSIDFHPNGREVLWTSQRGCWSPTLAIRRAELVDGAIDTDSIEVLLDDGQYVSPARYSPDGSLIAFTRSDASRGYDGPENVYVMASDGGGVRALTANTTSAQRIRGNLVWSADGSQLAFGQSQDWTGAQTVQIWVADVDGSGVTKLTDSTGQDLVLAW